MEGFLGIRIFSGGFHRRVRDRAFLPPGRVGLLVEMNNRYVSRVRRLVSREYLKDMKRYVFPLTSLPVELNLEVEVEKDYFQSTAAIGHPLFGYFGLVMQGLVLSALGTPVSILVDHRKAFLYPVCVENGQLSLDTGGVPFSSPDTGAVALAANKLLYLNDIVQDVVTEEGLSRLPENINRYLMTTLSGRI